MSIEGHVQDDRDGPINAVREALSTCLEMASQGEIEQALLAATEGIRTVTGARYVIIEAFGVPEGGTYSSGTTTGADPPEEAAEERTSPDPSSYVEERIVHGGQEIGLIRVFGTTGQGTLTQNNVPVLALFAAQVSLIVGRRRAIEEGGFGISARLAIENLPLAVFLLNANTREIVVETLASRSVLWFRGDSLADSEDSFGSLTFRSADGAASTLAEFIVHRVLSESDSLVVEEVVVEAPGERSLALEVSASPVLGEEGQVEYILVNVREATPQYPVETVGSEFWGRVSQYLWRLLTTIKGSAATALGSPVPLDPADIRHVLRLIDQQADQMRDLLGSLMDLTRIESGTLALTPESIRIADLVEQTLSLLLASGASYEVRFASGPSLPLARVDRGRLLQVLNRLISLSASRSTSAASVEVRAEAEGAGVKITVERQEAPNSGIHSRRSRESPWRDPDWEAVEDDLTIAICRGIVEAHGGRWNAEGQGSEIGGRFTFSLPAAPDDTAVEATEVVPGPLSSRSSDRDLPRILAIDSDPQALTYVQDTLSLAGYSPIATSNLEEVHSLIEAEVPQLVLLELMLPGTEGLELIGRIAGGLDAPVIFLSDRGREGELEQAFEMGGDDFIVKPFLPGELLIRVREVLRKRESQSRPKPSQIYSFQELEINYVERSVMVAGEPVRLSATEYRLLFELSISAGRLLTHTQLLRRVWGPEYGGDKRLVRAFVKNLRRKLGDDANMPKYIFTEAGAGYRMAKP